MRSRGEIVGWTLIALSLLALVAASWCRTRAGARPASTYKIPHWPDVAWTGNYYDYKYIEPWLLYGSLVSVIPGILVLIRVRLIEDESLPGHCPVCGYSIAGLAAGSPCPECGNGKTD